jgi:hypothetical protein
VGQLRECQQGVTLQVSVKALLELSALVRGETQPWKQRLGLDGSSPDSGWHSDPVYLDYLRRVSKAVRQPFIAKRGKWTRRHPLWDPSTNHHKEDIPIAQRGSHPTLILVIWYWLRPMSLLYSPRYSGYHGLFASHHRRDANQSRVQMTFYCER